MKTIALFPLLMLSACTVVHTSSPTLGHATYASLGGDSSGVMISPNGSTLASNNNSEAFVKGAAAVASIATAQIAGGVARTAYKQTGLTDRAGIASTTQKHGASVQAGTTKALSTDATAQALDRNKTVVDLAEIEKAKALGLKELDIPPVVEVPVE